MTVRSANSKLFTKRGEWKKSITKKTIGQVTLVEAIAIYVTLDSLVNKNDKINTVEQGMNKTMVKANESGKETKNGDRYDEWKLTRLHGNHTCVHIQTQSIQR